MTPAQLAALLSTAPAVVYFTMRDGTMRRMVTAPREDAATVRGSMIRVWDAEKGAFRTVNAATVSKVTPLAARRHAAAPVQHASARAAELRQWEDDFDTGFDAARRA